MGSTREEQTSFLEEWKCPECGVNDGLEICELTPIYSPAEPFFEKGKWHAKHEECAGADIFWDGAEKPIIYCLNCRAELDMEVIW